MPIYLQQSPLMLQQQKPQRRYAPQDVGSGEQNSAASAMANALNGSMTQMAMEQLRRKLQSQQMAKALAAQGDPYLPGGGMSPGGGY